jgi:hypothetical protein
MRVVVLLTLSALVLVSALHDVSAMQAPDVIINLEPYFVHWSWCVSLY